MNVNCIEIGGVNSARNNSRHPERTEKYDEAFPVNRVWECPRGIGGRRFL